VHNPNNTNSTIDHEQPSSSIWRCCSYATGKVSLARKRKVFEWLVLGKIRTKEQTIWLLEQRTKCCTNMEMDAFYCSHYWCFSRKAKGRISRSKSDYGSVCNWKCFFNLFIVGPTNSLFAVLLQRLHGLCTRLQPIKNHSVHTIETENHVTVGH